MLECTLQNNDNEHFVSTISMYIYIYIIIIHTYIFYIWRDMYFVMI